MDWTAWSSIAEIVSSAAIVATLVYLALQIRQNTDAMQAAARAGAAQGDVDWLYRLVDHPDVGLLMRKEEPLTELEASQVNACLVAFMRLKEVNFRQYKAGVLDEATWANYRSSIVNGPLSQPNARSWWLNFGQQLFDRELSGQISHDLRTAPLLPSFTSYFVPASPDNSDQLD